MTAAVGGRPRVTRPLPLPAGSGGAAGPAPRLSGAYGPGARSAGDRPAEPDALPLFAARGGPDAEAAGADPAAPVLTGGVVPNRPPDVLRAAAAGRRGGRFPFRGVVRVRSLMADRSVLNPGVTERS
ncbi:hypothetical protein M2169_005065 [Streptomyces sp. MJP52]|nr:hypothetical protein [Streptomyces sp. MJP52]